MREPRAGACGLGLQHACKPSAVTLTHTGSQHTKKTQRIRVLEDVTTLTDNWKRACAASLHQDGLSIEVITRRIGSSQGRILYSTLTSHLF